jgi:hypothetical protein
MDWKGLGVTHPNNLTGFYLFQCVIVQSQQALISSIEPFASIELTLDPLAHCPFQIVFTP